MTVKLRQLQATKAEAVGKMRAMQDKAGAESREFSAEEEKAYAELEASVKATNAAISREQTLAAEEAGLTAATGGAGGSQAPPARRGVVVVENVETDPRRGFSSFGDFSRSVMGATLAFKGMGGVLDSRLQSLLPTGVPLAAAPSTFANEAAGVDGGFLIPPEFSTSIFQLSLGEDALLPMTDNVQVATNAMVFPKDETTPWGSNGIRAYWQGEGTAAVATKPVLGRLELRLKKLMALVPVSDELAADASALASFLPKKVALSLRWKTNEAVLNGTGGPQPTGAFKSGAAIVVAKESGQATATLVPLNLAKMIARLPVGSYPNAVWIINNDVLPALFTLTLGNYPIYLPLGTGTQGGVQGNPYGMLLGRPIIVSQHAASFSSAGDVNLLDLSYYQSITKAGGEVQTDTSMHLYFDADALAYRTIFRLDGQSKIAAAIAVANGSNTLSPYVQLGAR